MRDYLQHGHARLMVATLAALALHASLLFISFPTPQHISMSAPSEPMQVSLLPIDVPINGSIDVPPKVPAQVTARVKEVRQASHKVTIQPKKQQEEKPNVILPTPAITPTPPQTQPEPEASSENVAAAATAVMAEVAAETAETLPANVAAISQDVVASESAMGDVPAAVQAQMLAKVSYPKRARRHGWEGRAEFEVRVYQQSIDQVTLLASTGFPLLDQAAQRGLVSVRDIPLSNGLYRMPVVFDLQ